MSSLVSMLSASTGLLNLSGASFVSVLPDGVKMLADRRYQDANVSSD